MSWVSQLYKTYEENIKSEDRDEESITPIAHMNANVQVEVTIKIDGSFRGAKEIEKSKGVTLIPVTESSAGRSSGVAPHSLCDMLPYVAGDFSKYCGNGKQKQKAEEKFNSYIGNLAKWETSCFSHSKVSAIFKYLQKKTLIFDLIHSGIVTLDGKKEVFDDRKIVGQPYEKVMVRFRVIEFLGEELTGTWEDPSLIEAYTDYYLSEQSGRSDICYVTGEEKTISENHPKGIVASAYGAKLVSANDGQGYTYRGLFHNAGQAYALSYEASQKIHSALTWLIKRQGVTIGTKEKRTFVCWNPRGKKVPDIWNNGADEEEDEDTSADTRKKVIKTLQGYADQFEADDVIAVMALDAATTGRLSITYYNEFLANDFFDRVLYWRETCRWNYLEFTPEKKAIYTEKTEPFYRIVNCAFGTERDSGKGNYIETNDKVLKERSERLLKCMLDKQAVPQDIVQALVLRASTPLAYSSWNREYVLSTVCAMITKSYYDRGIYKYKKGERETMKLDLENQDRSYLFGRLLAVFEKIERITYQDENREPNAIRLQSAYVNHPMQTWEILEEALNPYMQKLYPGTREKYRSLISEITETFKDEDKDKMNHRLGESYLLGYYLQRAELKKWKEKAEDK